jgi:hypothetical protein
MSKNVQDCEHRVRSEEAPKRARINNLFPSSQEDLELFSNFYQLNLDQLNGSTSTSTIVDSYKLRRGGCFSPEAQPWGQSTHSRLAPPTPGQSKAKAPPVSAICVTKRLHFGNSIQQISNAIALGESLGIDHLHLPGYWYIRRGRRQSASGIQLRNKKKINLRREQLALCGRFFYQTTLNPLYTAQPNPCKAMGKIADLLKLPETDFRPTDEDLVIHLRSGDIFSTNSPHPKYGQPPLAYYLKILHSRPWRSVHLIFQDEGNPVIAVLREIVNSLGIVLHCSTGNLKDDLAVLLAARTIACGTGTFISGVAAISQQLKTVYCFGKQFNAWGNTKISTIRLADSRGDYVSQVMSRNWVNSLQQRELMLSYPQEAIHFCR